MNELFHLAANSMLQIYGSDATLLKQNSSNEKIRISPLFHAKLYREQSTSRTETSDANIIISGCSEPPIPLSDRILRNDQEWMILSINEICSGIYELELKQ